MVSKSKLYLFCCLAPFLLRGLTWVKLCAWTSIKKSGRVLAFPFNPYLIIKVSKIIGLTPPPPPPPPLKPSKCQLICPYVLLNTLPYIQDGSLPYMDILIHADKSTSVYRKPIHTNLYVRYNFCSPLSSKDSVIRSLTRQAHILCSPNTCKRN